MTIKFTSKWSEFTPQSLRYTGVRSIKSPSDTSDTPIVGHSQSTTALIKRLHEGHQWLLNQHRKWQVDDLTAVSDEEFSRVWNGWWKLDDLLRTDYGFQGCIYGPDGTCPDGFPCLGCADLPVAAVVAQMALIEAQPPS
ncbi:MAG: hypothetical protein O2913_12975 [Chloroflexi bacterium]|nr:hypothetical protein [Chloroflexota bacterium]